LNLLSLKGKILLGLSKSLLKCTRLWESRYSNWLRFILMTLIIWFASPPCSTGSPATSGIFCGWISTFTAFLSISASLLDLSSFLLWIGWETNDFDLLLIDLGWTPC
jgi:hypothetical protein